MSMLAATRVVIADDSALMRSVMSAALREAGIDVVGQAADGDEALALCDRLAPDVLSLSTRSPRGRSTFLQSPPRASSCVVHGMPRAIVEAGLADAECNLSALPEAIIGEVGE